MIWIPPSSTDDFAAAIDAQAARTRREAYARGLREDFRAILGEAVASADYRHPLAATDPGDREGMALLLHQVLLHAHDRARLDFPHTSTARPLRVTVVAPAWVITAIPWHPRDEVSRSPNYQWVPMWEDPCADVWHLVALAGVEGAEAPPGTAEPGRDLVAPSILLDNYQWTGAYPVPNYHASMAPHQPCGGAHTDPRGTATDE